MGGQCIWGVFTFHSYDPILHTHVALGEVHVMFLSYSTKNVDDCAGLSYQWCTDYQYNNLHKSPFDCLAFQKRNLSTETSSASRSPTNSNPSTEKPPIPTSANQARTLNSPISPPASSSPRAQPTLAMMITLLKLSQWRNGSTNYRT